MALNLPLSVSSPQDLKELTADVRKYSKWYAQAARKQQVAGGGAEGQPAVSAAAAELINRAAAGESFDGKTIDGLIAELEQIEASAPSITITLAALAPGDLRKELVAWCRQNIAANVLVELRFNSTLLGGMVVRYGSHVYDWSFRRQILAAGAKFPEALRHV